ncbi:hypothetical protein GCM10017774_47540 [Lentzea cavernae]|uniref:Secreted protein n=1 Tax=Lentzea cavernae TaxID=2020703 RepID=A0ABQ3MS66_9PSEU|nr:hypothetical protein GCM10017774_47540 [Lentzea cavernae]
MLVAVTPLGASAAPVALAEGDRSQILGIAQRYLQNRAQKVTTGPQEPGFGVPVTAALARKLEVHEAKLDAARASAGTRYRAAVVETRSERFHVDQAGRTVVASLYEHTELHLAEPHAGPSTGYGLPHLLTFDRAGEGWVLADVALGHYKHCALLPETQRPSEC